MLATFHENKGVIFITHPNVLHVFRGTFCEKTIFDGNAQLLVYLDSLLLHSHITLRYTLKRVLYLYNILVWKKTLARNVELAICKY